MILNHSFFNINLNFSSHKICIIEVYLLKYYFESPLIHKRRYYRQTIFNQFSIMVSYVDIIMMWQHYHFKRILNTRLNFLGIENNKENHNTTLKLYNLGLRTSKGISSKDWDRVSKNNIRFSKFIKYLSYVNDRKVCIKMSSFVAFMN